MFSFHSFHLNSSLYIILCYMGGLYMKAEDIILKEEDMRDKIDVEHIVAYEQVLELAEYVSYGKALYDSYMEDIFRKEI